MQDIKYDFIFFAGTGHDIFEMICLPTHLIFGMVKNNARNQARRRTFHLIYRLKMTDIFIDILLESHYTYLATLWRNLYLATWTSWINARVFA